MEEVVHRINLYIWTDSRGQRSNIFGNLAKIELGSQSAFEVAMIYLPCAVQVTQLLQSNCLPNSEKKIRF